MPSPLPVYVWPSAQRNQVQYKNKLYLESPLPALVFFQAETLLPLPLSYICKLKTNRTSLLLWSSFRNKPHLAAQELSISFSWYLPICKNFHVLILFNAPVNLQRRKARRTYKYQHMTMNLTMQRRSRVVDQIGFFTSIPNISDLRHYKKWNCLMSTNFEDSCL